MRKNRSERDSESRQLCLKLMTTQAFVEYLAGTCECSCDGCVPWDHKRRDCISWCKRWEQGAASDKVPPRT